MPRGREARGIFREEPEPKAVKVKSEPKPKAEKVTKEVKPKAEKVNPKTVIPEPKELTPSVVEPIEKVTE